MPRGVVAVKHANSIYIEFVYKGRRCREYFNMIPSKQNIKWAADKRTLILGKIRDKTFNYADEFPESSRAILFGHARSDKLLKEYFEEYLIDIKKVVRPSTIRGYKIVIRAQLIPAFGYLRITDLTTKHIKDYIKGANFTIKYMINVLIPLRQILSEARENKVIKENPIEPITIARHMEKRPNKDVIDPYNEQERSLLINAAAPNFRNYVITALYTGLRNTCEMTALKWSEHIDFVTEVIKVRSGRVLKIEGETKTEAGNRDVPILPIVRKALEDQKKLTYISSEYVFLHPSTKKPIEHPQLVRLWKTLHKKAGVRWRSPKQTRHTFISMMCMAGENIFGLAKIVGHKNAKMIFEKYMRFIKDANKSHGHTFVNDWSKIS